MESPSSWFMESSIARGRLTTFPKRTKSGQKGYVLPYRCLEVKIHRNKKLKVAKSCLNSYPNGSWGRIEEQ